MPAVGVLTIGLLAFFFIKDDKLHGTAGIMYAVVLYRDRFRYEMVPFKALFSAVFVCKNN
jgi:hypothetical protein